jgi:MFS family permease
MLEARDIEAAVAAGVITAPQAQALREIAEKRLHERAALLSHEERFRFMSGFNDFFFAIGIILFGAGLIFFSETLSANNPIAVTVASLTSAALIWLLAELLVRRMRLVLPGILLSMLFVVFIFRAAPVIEWLIPSVGQHPPLSPDGTAPHNIAFKALTVTIAAALYYARFRLPFTLILIAGSLVLAIFAATVAILTDHSLVHILVLLGCGIGVFAMAMSFDASDPERLTRRADCAFWLHLLAAPLIVHSLVSLVTPTAFDIRSDAAAATLGIVAVLALIAIVIDRRAILVSAMAYVGVLISMAITSTVGWASQPGSDTIIFFATLLILGAGVIVLGIGWLPLRRRLIALLPSKLIQHLPPVPVSS